MLAQLILYFHSLHLLFFPCHFLTFLSSIFYLLHLSSPSPLWTFAMLSLTRRRQKCPVSFWVPPPFDGIHSLYNVSSSNKRHLLLLANLPPSFCWSHSLSQCLYLSLSPGISLLSAFYSKSNHKAFIQAKLRDSGYIWPAWYREMLYLWRRWGARWR